MASVFEQGFPPYPPQGKVAIVTGSSGGIGRSTAIVLARAGWAVAITARRQEQLEETAGLIHAAHPDARVVTVVGDITDEDFVVNALFPMTRQMLGRVDLVFCNAGTGTAPMPFAELSLADWNRTVNANLTASFLCSREAFKYMAQSGGRIIINGSISAHTPRPNSAPYTATKHGLTGLTKSLALDGRAFNIAVSQIDIGNASSDMTAGMSAGPGPQQANGTHAIEPVMDREHVAREVVHIAEMPLSVNVQFVTILATKMPYIGRG